MANAFDQFDAPVGKANAFDQFDSPKADSAPPDPAPKTDSRTYADTKTYKKDTPSFEKGLEVGIDKFGIGSAQLFSQIGTKDHNLGQIMPVINNGKLEFGYPPQAELAEKAKALDKRSESLDTAGKVGEFFGDPTLLALPEAKSLPVAMAIQSAISSALSPSSEKTKTLGERAAGAGISSALSYGLGKAAPVLVPAAKGAASLAGKAVPDGIKTAVSAWSSKVQGSLATLGVDAGKLIKQAGESISKGISAPTGEVSAPSKLYEMMTKMGIRLTGKETATEVWSKLETAVRENPARLAEKISEGSSLSSLHPLDASLKISEAYGAAVASNSALYEKARVLGEKEFTQVDDIAKHVKNIIDHMEEIAPAQSFNPGFHTALASMKRMQQLFEKQTKELVTDNSWEKVSHVVIDRDAPEPKLSGAQLIEINQALNENYGRTGFEGAKGRELKAAQAAVKEAIQKMSPQFSHAYEVADTDFVSNVHRKFRDNTYLKEVWQPEDFRMIQDIQRGIRLDSEVRKRMETLLDHVTTYSELSELKNTGMDPRTYDTVRAAVFLHTMNKVGIDPDVLKNKEVRTLLDKALENEPQAMAVLDTMVGFADEMKTRGIKKAPTAVELEASNNRLDSASRMMFHLKTGNGPAALRRAYRAVVGEPETAASRKLTGLAKDTAEGAPQPTIAPGAITKAVGRVGATKEGEQF